MNNAFCRRNGVVGRVAQPGWFVMDFHARSRARNDYLFREAIITNGILFLWCRNTKRFMQIHLMVLAKVCVEKL